MMTMILLLAMASADAGHGGREAMRERFEARFNEADQNDDGQLSREESEAMPRVHEHFDAIDANDNGTITREEIQKHLRRMREERDQRGDKR